MKTVAAKEGQGRLTRGGELQADKRSALGMETASGGITTVRSQTDGQAPSVLTEPQRGLYSGFTCRLYSQSISNHVVRFKITHYHVVENLCGCLSAVRVWANLVSP